MAAHTKEQFDLFMSQLRETNATLDFYCDFPKIARNVADIEISLNSLNYLSISTIFVGVIRYAGIKIRICLCG